MRLPTRLLLRRPRRTGVVVVSADGRRPLYAAMYEGPRLASVASAVPGAGGVYLANESLTSSDRDQTGVVRLKWGLTEPIDLLQTSSVAALVQSASPHSPVLVIVDTLAWCMTGDEDSSEKMGLAVAACDRVRRELKCAVLILHHPTKSRLVERGSGALRAALDTVILLEREGDVVTLTCEKQRHADRFKPISLKLEEINVGPDVTSCVVSSAGASLNGKGMLSHHQRLALEVLAQSQSATLSRKEWFALVSVKERTMYRIVKDLMNLGYVTKVKEGVYRITETGMTATANDCHATVMTGALSTAATVPPL